MLDLTAAAEVDGQKFDGVDLFLFHPHIDIDSTDDAIRRAWPTKSPRKAWSSARSSRPFGRGTVGGSAMGDDEDRAQFRRRP